MNFFTFSRKFSRKFSINQWLASRPWKLFWFCLPAGLAIGLLCLVTLLAFIQSSLDTHHRYDRLAREALAAGKFEAARVVCLRGLAGQKNELDRAQWLYYLAIALNGLGQSQDATALVNAAAPLDRPGCLDAHLLVAQNLLIATNLTPEVLALAEQHLKCALKLDPQSLPGNEMLARFEINTRKIEPAQARLMAIYSRKPDTALLLAITYDMQTNGALATSWADRALSAYEKKLLKSAPKYQLEDRQGLVSALMIKQKNTTAKAAVPPPPPPPDATTAPPPVVASVAPQDSPVIWLGIVRLLMSNGKYGPALQTLEQQMLVTSNAVYSAALAEVCVVWAAQILPSQTNGAALRLQLIQKGLTNAPANINLQMQLLQLTHQSGDSAGEAKKLLDQCVAAATGTAAAWWHFALWTDFRIRGDLVAARQHLQTAYQLAPDLPPIKNDLALDLSSGDRADRERGLQLIQSVLEQYPYEPGFRETRGEILVLLGRNQEALTDLEFAAPRLPNATETRQLLAKVYAALGLTPLVDNSWQQLAQVHTLMNQGQYTSAMKILDQAMLVSTNPAYATAMADLCAAWLEKLRPEQASERFDLLQKGLTQVPQHPKLRASLLSATQGTNDSAATAKQLLDRLVATATGDAAVQWQLFLGREARLRGDLGTARQLLQSAFELAPHLSQVQFELAQVLAAGDQTDLAAGLKLIAPLVDQFPTSPDFHNARGLILARLGRNQEAVADLEFAVARLANPTATRLTLAKVYDALGKTKLADQLRRFAGSTKTP